MTDGASLLVEVIDYHLHQGVQVTLTLVVGNDSLFGAIEGKTLTLGTWTNLCNIVETKHHIL